MEKSHDALIGTCMLDDEDLKWACKYRVNISEILKCFDLPHGKAEVIPLVISALKKAYSQGEDAGYEAGYEDGYSSGKRVNLDEY